MKNNVRDRAEGKFYEVKGKIREKAGRATRNPNLQYKGTAEKVSGKVQKKMGEIEKVVEG